MAAKRKRKGKPRPKRTRLKPVAGKPVPNPAPARRATKMAASVRRGSVEAVAPGTSDGKQKWETAAESRIFPRNLTAMADYLVPGNPVITRPEDAVANCFPGLELDVRNFDRRFFPGLVFNFVSDDPPRGGALLSYLDLLEDPDLQIGEAETESLYDELNVKREVAQRLYDDLSDGSDVTDKLSDGKWYLDWVEQEVLQQTKGRKNAKTRRTKARMSLTGLAGPDVWRVVRGLEPGPLTIGLVRRHESQKSDGATKKKKTPGDNKVKLVGWRRRFTDPVTGVINGAYQPGELMQGLCSPWQHDFRDCACHYWASSHPDLVLPEVPPGELLVGGQALDHPVLDERVDWLRSDRSRDMAAAASDTIPKNRPYQLDHYQINSEWQNLNVVLENREISAVYVPEVMDTANPFKDLDELVEVLVTWLAPLEMALALEYLFTYFTIQNPKKIANSDLRETVEFVREHLLMTAASEMQHLRWANELLWGLTAEVPFTPVLTPSKLIPTGPGRPVPKQLTIDAVYKYMRPAGRPKHATTSSALEDFEKNNENSGFRYRALRALDPVVQADFIAVEHERGFIDFMYSRVVATLRQAQYPDHLIQLPLRVLSDGMRHESEFLQIQAALKPFDPAKYLRTLKTPDGPTDKTQPALDLIDEIVAQLKKAYDLAGNELLARSSEPIAEARTAMYKLLEVGETLAAKGIGIPFFNRWGGTDPKSSGSAAAPRR
jgi:hypothetical protein